MGLKLAIKALDEVDEKFRHLISDAGGYFELDLDSLPDVGALEATTRALRRELKAAQTALKSYTAADGKPIDPSELAALLTTLKTAADGKPIDPTELTALLAELGELRQQKEALGKSKDEQVQAAIERVRREFTPQVEQLSQRLTATEAEREAAQKRLRTYRIESALERAAVEARVRPEFLEDVRLRADRFMLLEDEPDDARAVVMVGQDGEPMNPNRAGQRYVYPQDWFAEQAKVKPSWFEPSSGGGAGGGPKRGPSGPGFVDRDDSNAFLANLESIANNKVTVN